VSVPGAGASSAGREEIAAARRMHELITRSLLVQAVFVASRLRIPDLAPAENIIRAGQAACSYALRIPPSRWCRRMSR
jgi:hypothetical protein